MVIITVKELSQLYYLSKEIEKETQKKQKYEDRALKVTSLISGMPSGGGVSDKTAIAAEIADCESIIESKKQQAVIEYNRLIRYIAGINDSFIKQIIEKRFLEMKSWPTVAKEIGGYNTRDSVRMAVNRFLQKN